MHTKITDMFGVEHPIVSAGMGGVAMAELAAAVSEAGGLGTIGLAGFGPEAIQNEIAAARKITSRPLLVNMLVPFLRPGLIEVALEQPVNGIVFFWGDPEELIPRYLQAARSKGIRLIWQCGSIEEALAARRADADAIIVQGVEAGGHVRGVTSALTLLPAVRDGVGDDFPILAAGGFADGRGLAAALALGADGAVFGTRFLASNEAHAHRGYKERVVAASADETELTELYDIGWPNAKHRVIRTRVFDQWDGAGRPRSGQRPHEGEIVGKLGRGGVDADLVKYAVQPPSRDFEGDIEELPFYAGMSVDLIHEILPASEIVRRIVADADAVVAGRLH